VEHERLEFKVVVDDTDSPDIEILTRAASLDIAAAAYMAAVAKHPLRNIALRQGAQVIKRHDGEPQPEPPHDPNLKSWSVHLIGGKRMQSLGWVEAVSEAAAIERAVVLYGLDNQKRTRLAVNLREKA
jgi:hypothetical protein